MRSHSSRRSGRFRLLKRALLMIELSRSEDVAASGLAGGLRCGLIAYRDETGEREVSWPHSFRRLLESEPLAFDPSPDPSIPAVIFFTSGSTGPAKGVTHSRSRCAG